MKPLKENGFLSIEAIGAVIISLFSLVLGAELYNNWCDNLEFNVAAQHLLEVEKGAKNYINDHYHILVEETNNKKIATKSIQLLKNKKYLPTSFSNTNSFGQTYTVKVKKAPPVNANPQLQAIILTEGGSPITELGVRKIATMLGAHGGYFAEKSGQRVIQGALGAWSEKADAFGLDPGNGHLAAALFFIDGKSVSMDFLYRKTVPGKPELNQMQTPLNMGMHDIVNAKDIKATGKVTTTSLFATAKIEADSIRSKNRLSTGEFLQIDGGAEEGSFCSGKVVGIDSNGTLLFCTKKEWRSVMFNPKLIKQRYHGEKICTNTAKKNTVAKCPSGFFLTGAGHNFEYLTSLKQHQYGELEAYPVINGGWYVDVSRMTDICVTPVVICMAITNELGQYPTVYPANIGSDS